MFGFSVEKIEWEYGEQYGYVFYPQAFVDLQSKIDELHSWGKTHNYPFLIILHFYDTSIYLGFTVGHEYSFMEFAYDVDAEKGKGRGPFYLVNPQGNPSEIIPIYYMASQSMLDTTKMLHYDQVLAAVYFFVNHQMFPYFITFDQEEVNQMFIVSS